MLALGESDTGQGRQRRNQRQNVARKLIRRCGKEHEPDEHPEKQKPPPRIVIKGTAREQRQRWRPGKKRSDHYRNEKPERLAVHQRAGAKAFHLMLPKELLEKRVAIYQKTSQIPWHGN